MRAVCQAILFFAAGTPARIGRKLLMRPVGVKVQNSLFSINDSTSQAHRLPAHSES
jgi:hypothetical protein